MRRRTFTFLLVGFAFAVLSSSSRADRGRIVHGSQIGFGLQGLVEDGVCYVFGGVISSGDYFRGLRRVDTPDGTVFFKGPIAVAYYPQQLDVTVTAAAARCPPSSPGDSGVWSLPSSFIESLAFEVAWKRGLQMRKVDRWDISAKERRSDGIWKVRLRVATDKVPLSDHLIVTVKMPGSNSLIRLAAEP